MSKNLTTGVTPELNGSGHRIALICARWNDVIVNRLENGAREALVNAGVAEGDIVSIKVPGALEIPIAMKAALATGTFDAAIALGVVPRLPSPATTCPVSGGRYTRRICRTGELRRKARL